MASSLCLPHSPLSLLQRPSKAQTPPSKAHTSPRSASPCVYFSRLSPVRGELNLDRLQITGALKLRRRFVVRMAPDVDRLTRRNPLDFPAEWERTRNPRRPDVLPQFSPLRTPLPAPMPFDPPLEDDEEEEQQVPEEEEELDDDEYEE